MSVATVNCLKRNFIYFYFILLFLLNYFPLHSSSFISVWYTKMWLKKYQVQWKKSVPPQDSVKVYERISVAMFYQIQSDIYNRITLSFLSHLIFTFPHYKITQKQRRIVNDTVTLTEVLTYTPLSKWAGSWQICCFQWNICCLLYI